MCHYLLLPSIDWYKNNVLCLLQHLQLARNLFLVTLENKTMTFRATGRILQNVIHIALHLLKPSEQLFIHELVASLADGTLLWFSFRLHIRKEFLHKSLIFSITSLH